MLSRKTLIVLFILLSFFVCFIPFRFSQTAYAATPLNLSYSDVTKTSVKLSWSKTGDLLFQHYQIYMRTKGATDWKLVWTINDMNNLTHTVTGLSPGTTYEFKVVDTDLLGQADSNIIEVTTIAEPIYLQPNFWFIVAFLVLAIIIIILLLKRYLER